MKLLSWDYGDQMVAKIIMLSGGDNKVEREVIEIWGNGGER